MAEIIDIFSRKKLNVSKDDNKAPDSEIKPKEKEAMKEMAETVELSESSSSMLDEIMKKLDGMDKGGKSVFTRMNMIENLRSSSSTEALQDKIVASYDKDELHRWIMESNEHDWKKKPAFFKAVVRRYRALAVSEK
jgi:hypothetical protein